MFKVGDGGRGRVGSDWVFIWGDDVGIILLCNYVVENVKGDLVGYKVFMVEVFGDVEDG